MILYNTYVYKHTYYYPVFPPCNLYCEHSSSIKTALLSISVQLFEPSFIANQDQHTVPAKGQMVNTLGFSGHMVSVIATQLCCNGEAAIDDT